MSLVLTLMQSLRAKYKPGTLDKLETRRSRYGAWDFFQRQTASPTGIITPDVKALIKKSMGNTVQVPVLDARDVVITNVRSCTVPESENTSKLVTLTFVTYSFGFTMYPSQYFNNDIGYQADFDRKLEMYLQKFALTLDTTSANYLNTNRNQYFPADITTYYPVVGNALQVTQAQKNDFYNQAEAILNTMDFYGQTNVISSTTGKPTVNRLKADAVAGSQNNDFQVAGYEWGFTNRITNGAGVQATMYLVANDVVGVENRNDPDALAGSKVPGGSKVWGLADMPLVNMQMGTYYYADCGNISGLHAGTAHLTATLVEGFQWSTDVCYVKAYNSDPVTKYQPILKAEISAA